nr:VanZ family protein [Pseudonocardia spinosispora]
MFRRLAPFATMILISLYALFSPASGVPFLPPGFDKIAHFCLFAALAFTGRRANICASHLGASLVVYAVVSEILQAVLPINRDGDVWDAAVDLCGVAIGLWLFSRARRRDHHRSGHADG